MSSNAIRILVVDDELTARLLMRAALVKAGFEVFLAENGAAALSQFQAQACDLVMLDVGMPGMDGYQVCAALRAAVGDELPIVMVTGLDDLESVERAFDAGATDFIAKPINWALIGHRVRYLLRGFMVLQDLHGANARNAAILNAMPDTLLRLDASGRVLDVRSKGRAQRSRYLPRPGFPLAETFPADIADQALDLAARARTTGAVESMDIKLVESDGEECHYDVRLASISNHETLCLVRDITERKEAEKKVFRLAYLDTLTGLPNRLSFSDRLQRDIQRARLHNSKLAVLFMDLDGFKNVNDTLGHGAGDLLLQWVADRLRLAVRPADLLARNEASEMEVGLARLGGDEFTLLMPQLHHVEDALIVGQRIHARMRQPFMLEGREIIVTTSIGIAVYPDDGEDAATLLKHADTAMYHAKNQGRDNCQFYSAALTREAMRRLNMESNLRLALERGEFYLVYQPQLDLDSGRIHSLEALIRWQHPEQGPISPADFIPAAEENGLIVPIGDWVLRTACADIARWQAAGHSLRVAVNLSAVQFRNPDLVSAIKSILAESEVAPEWLELEVTEGALMDDSAATLAILDDLRAAGMQLSLDDFGTGYSSLSHLQRLPLNNLKVGRSFVCGLPADKGSLAIVRAIVSLARNLGFTVTAEGIETLEQARILQRLGCETLQGAYISEPVPAADIPALLARHWRVDGGQGSKHD